jgi:hypothetical protein
MDTLVIRSECDKIDAEFASNAALITQLQSEKLGLEQQLANAASDAALLREEIARLQARIDELESQVPDPDPEPVELVVVSPPALPSTAPVVGVPFVAVSGVYEGPVVSLTHRWWAPPTKATNNTTLVGVAGTDNIGQKVVFEDIVTLTDGTVRSFKTDPSLPIVAAPAPEPEPDPDPAPDPEPDPDPLPGPEPVPGNGTVNVTVWAAPEATGDGSGSSPENMATLATALTKGPGTIGLIADRGVWPAFTHSIGAEHNGIAIYGVNEARQPLLVEIKGSRPLPQWMVNPDWDPEWTVSQETGGQTLFNLSRGLNGFKLGYIHGKNLGEVIRVNGTIQNFDLDHVKGTNFKEWIWMDDDNEPTGTGLFGAGLKRSIAGFNFEGLDFDGFELAMRLFGDTRDGVVRGFQANGRRHLGHISWFATIGKGDSDRSCTCHNITFEGAALGYSGVIKNIHDQKFEKPWMHPDGSPKRYSHVDSDGWSPIGNVELVKNLPDWGNDDVPGSTYWNGDAFSAEGNTYDLTFKNIVGEGITDAVFDVKSRTAVFENCGGRNTKRTFRLWKGTYDILGGFSHDPFKRGGSGGTAHIYMTGGRDAAETGTTVNVDGLQVRGAPSRVFIKNSDATHNITINFSNLDLDGHTTEPGEG